MSRLIVLYPRAWRDRYEVEFRMLVAERPLSPGDWLDIVRGALDARLHPQVGARHTGELGPSTTTRIGAVLGVAGGALWIATALAFYGATYNPGLGYKDSGSAIAIAVAAGLVTGVAALAIHQSLRARHAVMWISATAILIGGFAMAFPWPVLLIGFLSTIVGTLLFGLAGAVAPLGRRAGLLCLAALPALLFNTEDERALYLIPLGVVWMVLGFLVGLRGVTIVEVDPLRASLDLPRPRSDVRPGDGS